MRACAEGLAWEGETGAEVPLQAKHRSILTMWLYDVVLRPPGSGGGDVTTSPATKTCRPKLVLTITGLEWCALMGRVCCMKP